MVSLILNIKKLILGSILTLVVVFSITLLSLATPETTILTPIPPQKLLAAISDDDFSAIEEDDGNSKTVNAKLMRYILDDKAARISDEFSIPADLRKRVEFWFQIYSTYTISNAVIHDNDHPWIVYDVINLNSIYSKYKKSSQRRAAKSRMIRNARYRYINILDKLSKKSRFSRLSKEEKQVFSMFKDIQGTRKKIFSRAKKRVRVQLGQRDSVIYGIKRSGKYLKNMEAIFKKNKLPVELTRIPFLESSFNLKAYSKDGASGIWQFMYKTGKIFLNVSRANGIDERNHPLKATKAAAKLLKQNYRILKNWPLAVTAYNHGPGGLLRGSRKVKSKNLNDLIEGYKHSYFGFASKNFFSCFLAILHTERYQDKIFGYLQKDRLLVHDDIQIKYSMRVKFIKKLCDIDMQQIKTYNPDLKHKALKSRSYLPEGYYFKMPQGKKQCLTKFYKEVEDTNKILDQLLGKKSRKKKI